MTRRIIIMMFVGIFAAAMPGMLLAEVDGMGDYIASDAKSAEAGMWLGSGPVETGAVPDGKSEPSLIDTHFNPFHPELREIDRVGSTGG